MCRRGRLRGRQKGLGQAAAYLFSSWSFVTAQAKEAPQLTPMHSCQQRVFAGGAGSGGARGARGKLSALLRGRRSSADAIKVQGVTGEHLRAAAQLTAGFSGRELAKLMASVQVRGLECCKDLGLRVWPG